MPVEKFRDVSKMGAPPRETEPEKLLQKIEFVWSMASLAPKNMEPPGIQKFRSIEEANEARQSYMKARRLRTRLKPVQ